MGRCSCVTLSLEPGTPPPHTIIIVRGGGVPGSRLCHPTGYWQNLNLYQTRLSYGRTRLCLTLGIFNPVNVSLLQMWNFPSCITHSTTHVHYMYVSHPNL